MYICILQIKLSGYLKKLNKNPTRLNLNFQNFIAKKSIKITT